jgi:O-antigen/teichoic acid export membrane protein
MTTTVAGSVSLRQQVVRGLRWKIFSQLAGQGSRLVVGVLLAHLLTPGQFGLAAMALVFTGVASIFTDLSLGAALVQRTTITEEDLSTAFWTTLGAGAVMTVGGVALAPLAGDFFSNSAVVPLFAATAAVAFLSSLAVTQTAILTREMDFRSLEIRTIVSTLAGAATAVGIAVAGFGAWAIVSQALCVAAVSTVLLWRLSPWRPRLLYSAESLRTLGSFGMKTLFSRILVYLNLNTDNILVGRYLGSRPLGVYAIAYNVMFIPMQQVAQPIQAVLFAAFVKLKDDRARLGQEWLRGARLICALSVPAFLGMAVVAPDFIPVVFGQRWHAAVPVLQLLSLAGAAESFKMLNWSVFQAMGKPGDLLRFMVFSSIVTLGAFVAGLTWGVVGVAGLFAIARTISAGVYTWFTCRMLGLPIRRFVELTTWVLMLTLPMVVGVYGARVALVHEQIGTGPRLAALVLLGIVLYAGLVFWRGRELVAELRQLVGREGQGPAGTGLNGLPKS